MTYFTERQHARQPWLLAIIAAMAAVGWWSLIQQVLRGKPVGNNPINDWGVVVLWLLTGIGAPLLLLWMHLETVVEPGGISVGLLPFTRRKIAAEEIDRFYARTYKPLREYGGWGLRGRGNNRAYNMSGDQGLQLELTNGDRILIGTQRPHELEAAIAAMTGKPPAKR
jgi:hypothetical protein